MSGPFDTQISIGAKDNATPVIRSIRTETRRMQEAREQLGVRGERAIRREIQQTEASFNRLARSGTLSAAELSRAQEKAAAKIARLQKEMAEAEVQGYARRNAAREAYSALGVRSEHTIQREIQRTEAAYNRLERSGVLSAGEQLRAYEQMTSTVAKLKRELGETERVQVSLSSRFKAGLTLAGGVAGGITGVGMALRQPITDAASYDAELRKQANFAYSDRSDVKGRLAGMRDIDSAVHNAVDKSGASADEAFSGFETMMRSGVVSRKQAYKFLPNVLRNAVATGADAASVANTQASAVNFGLNDEDAPAALSVLTTMAQHGRIDVPELAREMPRGLEAGKSAGFHGQRGFASLAAFFEASAIGAKDPQDAATNANDFLAEMTSNNLTANGKRIKIKGRKLDIPAMMRNDLAKGLTPLDTITGIVGAMDKDDPQYRRYQQALKGARTPAEREQLEAQLNQIHGQHISKLLPNQQSRNAYINFDRNRDFYNAQVNEGVEQFKLPDGQRSADRDFNFVADSPQWKMDREKHVNALVGNDAMKGVTGVWGDLMKNLTDLEQAFPQLTTAASGAATALKGIAGSIGGSMIGGWFAGGGLKKVKDWFGRGATEAGEIASSAGEAASEAGEVIGHGGGKFLKVLGGKLNPLGDIIMGAENFYSEFIERGSDKMKGVKLPAGGMALHPVGALDVWDELRDFFKQMGKTTPGGSGSGGRAPQPIVNNIYLDSRLVTQQIMEQSELNSRRHGA